MPFLNDRAIREMVAIAAKDRAQEGALRGKLETWAQTFSENLEAEGQEREQDRWLTADLEAFSMLSGRASELLAKLAGNPALSGATPAQVYLAAAMLGEAAEADAFPLGEAAEEAAKLEALGAACQSLAASLAPLVGHALAAAKAAKVPGGRPRQGEKLAAVSALLTIFDAHSATTPAGRTVDEGKPRGAFNDFLKIAFDGMGVPGNIDEWARAAIRLRDHGGNGDG